MAPPPVGAMAGAEALTNSREVGLRVALRVVDERPLPVPVGIFQDPPRSEILY